MKYTIVVAIAVVIIFLLMNNAIRKAKEKRLRKLRNDFGKTKNEYFNFDRIALYFKQNKDKKFQELSAQTLADIDLHNVFEFADRTSSSVGQQYFYDKLCSPVNDIASLQQFDRQADFFLTEKNKREQSQLILQQLSDNDAYSVVSLVFDKMPVKPAWFSFLYINVFLLVILLLLSVKFPVLLLWAFIPAGINIFLGIWNKAALSGYARSLPQLNVLIKVAERLRKIGSPVKDEYVSESIVALNSFRKKMRLMVFDRDSTTDELAKAALFIFEIVRSIFAVEIFVFNALLKNIFLQQNSILTLFKYVGETDASIAVADLRYGLKVFCKPSFLQERKELSGKNICHPLIENCIGNDLEISLKSVLITGSNMSGKTTFLRTIALNALTAQTIFTCFADEFNLPFVKIYSSVRIDDDLLQGKSYYAEEVNIIKILTDAADADAQCLFVLDEVFKGTNTLERVALGKAVLNYLNRKNNIVLVATHDLELADLLSQEYELYYFTETVENGEMQFDHHINHGKLNVTNAIKLIELSGFPASVIKEAYAIKDKLGKE